MKIQWVRNMKAERKAAPANAKKPDAAKGSTDKSSAGGENSSA